MIIYPFSSEDIKDLETQYFILQSFVDSTLDPKYLADEMSGAVVDEVKKKLNTKTRRQLEAQIEQLKASQFSAIKWRASTNLREQTLVSHIKNLIISYENFLKRIKTKAPNAFDPLLTSLYHAEFIREIMRRYSYKDKERFMKYYKTIVQTPEEHL